MQISFVSKRYRLIITKLIYYQCYSHSITMVFLPRRVAKVMAKLMVVLFFGIAQILISLRIMLLNLMKLRAKKHLQRTWMMHILEDT